MQSSPVLDTQHQQPGAGSVSPVAHTSPGVSTPGTGAKPGLGQQRKQLPHAPAAPLTHSRTFTKPRGSRSMLKSTLKPTIMGETKAASRNQDQHQPTASASPAPPYRGTPCHTPSPGDGGWTHPQILSCGSSGPGLVCGMGK